MGKRSGIFATAFVKWGVVLLVAVTIAASAISLAPHFMGAKPRPKHVILIVVDSLRADRLGCYGYTREIDGRRVSLTPNMDALADKGALFEACIAQSNWTATSMASMLYSINPTVRTNYHSFDYLESIGNGHCLLSELPRALLESDFQRGNVQTNPYLVGAEFTSLFDVVINAVPHPFREASYERMGSDVQHADAAVVNESSLSMIDIAVKRDRSMFLYAHYMDVHEPYIWREEYRKVFADGAKEPESFHNLRIETPAQYEAVGRTGLYEGEFAQRIQRLSNDYDACLMYLDMRIGELLEGISQRLPAEDTMIVLASDHGQEFGEHGNIGHCLDMYGEEVDVPLIMCGGEMPPGARVRSYVRNIDIIPTISRFIEFYPKSEGEDLTGLVLEAVVGRPTSDREVFSCSDYSPDINPHHKLTMLISRDRLKYVVTEDESGVVLREELYDIAADKDERSNILESRPDDVAAMRQRIQGMYAPGEARGVTARPASGAAPATRERLRAVGYLQ